MPRPKKQNNNQIKLSKSQLVYDQIVERIKIGTYAPNKRMVNRALSKELNTSTIPVREAIQRLLSEGLLEHRGTKGAFVPHLKVQDIERIYDVRIAMELLAASDAAKHRSDHQIQQMDTLCQRWHELADSIRQNAKGQVNDEQIHEWAAFEDTFHGLVATMSGNRYLISHLNHIRNITMVYVFHRYEPKLLSQEAPLRIVQDHRNLIPCIQNKDSSAASRWMNDHIRVGRAKAIENYYDPA